jgi:hypothetical protein
MDIVYLVLKNEYLPAGLSQLDFCFGFAGSDAERCVFGLRLFIVSG